MKLCLLLLVTLFLYCGKQEPTKLQKYDWQPSNTTNLQIVVVDSCEYLFWGQELTHKGNCKFCKERMKKNFTKTLEDFCQKMK
jgi:hypothetical protein